MNSERNIPAIDMKMAKPVKPAAKWRDGIVE